MLSYRAKKEEKHKTVGFPNENVTALPLNRAPPKIRRKFRHRNQIIYWNSLEINGIIPANGKTPC